MNDATAFQREQPMSLVAYQRALLAAQQEVAALNDKYLRAAAALDNTRKHAERDVTMQVNQRLQRMVFNMLEVADTLERALPYSTPNTPLHSGLQATHQQLLGVLRGEGVLPMQIIIGSHPDPVRQEAVGKRASDEMQFTIAAVQRNGYTRNGEVLRPAQVIISDPGALQ
jgi:molecular chaperone GrpE